MSARAAHCPPVSVVNRRPLRTTRCDSPPELALPPDHRTPGHLRGEAQRPTGRREVKGTGGTEPKEVEVLDLRAREAEVEEADLPHALHARGGRSPSRARGTTRLSCASVMAPPWRSNGGSVPQGRLPAHQHLSRGRCGGPTWSVAQSPSRSFILHVGCGAASRDRRAADASRRIDTPRSGQGGSPLTVLPYRLAMRNRRTEGRGRCRASRRW